MKLEKQYVCPKCNWAITGELRDRTTYTCQVCRNDFTVRRERDGDTVNLFHRPNEFRDEPMGLPRGSVRATVMILLSFSVWYLILDGQDVPDYLLNLLIIVVGYYFVIRTTYLGVTSLEGAGGSIGARKDTEATGGGDRIQIEQEPLYLPRGSIRLFILLGFSVCAFSLVEESGFSDMRYKEFFFILLGLMVGFVMQKATAGHRREKWYLLLGHLKALTVLGMAMGIFVLVILNSLEEVDGWIIRLFIAFIGFYFTSR